MKLIQRHVLAFVATFIILFVLVFVLIRPRVSRDAFFIGSIVFALLAIALEAAYLNYRGSKGQRVD